MDDMLSIRVNVADRFYPLKIKRVDEERIRKAAKMINDKVLQYKQHYSDKDLQDFLGMASLQFVIKLLELEEKQDTSPIIEAARELNHELDDILARE
ncbi:cell division protein ZapA [Labilibacter marinus]|uniref:cell division protein ZapA n=1 Tax=Labilibacter marinus TaxID=1477105 RepID=UPI00094F76F4|nr:cell division protein ZapA [Labilibacter marinus]